MSRFSKIGAHQRQEPGQDSLPEGIARIVKPWRSVRDLPGFKPE
ncbi:bacteriocin immunity protein [Pseudomonas koreensis]|nr:bacteriocin immunity protein [Pseudomonas koreensis]